VNVFARSASEITARAIIQAMASDNFEEMLRAMARELSQSVERAAREIDLEGIAETIGVDPDMARDWMQSAGEWLRAQTGAADTSSNYPAAPTGSALAPVTPHPLDLPTEDQGVALAALDSGRWTIEPGTSALTARGEGPGPSDALGLARELRLRDWIDADGEITLAGRGALRRWLDASR
jgi:hypothetical protein